MRSVFFLLPALLIASPCFAAEVESIEKLSTHQQTGIIKLQEEDSSQKLNAFCLNHKGQIIAVCGMGPGEIRVVDDEGSIINSWKVDVKPESVGVGQDDLILVGGEGKLFRFDATGSLITEVDSPHAARLRDSRETIRKEAIALLERRRSMKDPLETARLRVSSYERMLTQLKDRKQNSELNASEERLIKLLPDLLERYQNTVNDLEEQAAKMTEKEKAAAEAERKKGPTEKEIETQVDTMIRSKMRVASISSSGEHVFVTTRGVTGYGFDVWKMGLDFDNAEVVVKGLSGCCGQMDVQCCKDGLFVAENSRDRVVHYDVDGKEITKWGKSDRTGINGFGSCCNPMNVCFDKEGFVYTAESNLGRIKKFDTEGNLVAYVGDVELVPGCKNVSIAVSPVNSKIYMLDLTRNHIKVMEPKPEGALTKQEKVESLKVKVKAALLTDEAGE